MIEHYKNDKSTIFSIVPFSIDEFKPGLYPGRFKIEPCTNDALPKQLVIGASEHLMHVEGQPRPHRLVTPSFVIAKSVVDDFLDGQLWTEPEAHPGIMWLPQEITVATFLTEHKAELALLRTLQRAWYVRICKETDNDWSRYENSRVVSNQARFAAKALGLEPDWLNTEVVGFEHEKCPACGASNNKSNAVCSTCRCILDEAKFKSLKFTS